MVKKCSVNFPVIYENMRCKFLLLCWVWFLWFINLNNWILFKMLDPVINLIYYCNIPVEMINLTYFPEIIWYSLHLLMVGIATNLYFKPLQAESAIAALNCSGVVLGSLPIRLVVYKLFLFTLLLWLFLLSCPLTHHILSLAYACLSIFSF